MSRPGPRSLRYRTLGLVLGVAACGSTPPAAGGPGGAAGSSAAAGEPATNCTTSDDCELVQACCGCNAGGRQFAIRKDAIPAYEAARPVRCADQMCAQVISDDPSCTAEAICGGDGRCQVAPHLQHE